MTADPHARAARAERRWTKRGRSLSARLLYWLSLRFPWAWRVRLDLILAFNLILALMFIALSQVVGPALVDRTADADPEFASATLLAIDAVAACGFGLAWAFAVSKSMRLRNAARHGDQPGVILASLVFLSFASWAVAAGVSPHIQALRDPLLGEPIETSIKDRSRQQGQTQSRYYGVAEVSLSPIPRLSDAVCEPLRPAPDVDALPDEARKFLCAYARKARRADLWSALTFDARHDDWRREGAQFADHPPSVLVSLVDIYPSEYVRDVGLEVIRFAAKNEPWKSRIASMRPWERTWDVLDDPTLPAAFARSRDFEHFVALDILFGRLRGHPSHLFESASDEPEIEAYMFEAAARPATPLSARWQAKVQRELMATPAFADALAAAEQTLAGDAPTPLLFSAAEWERVRLIRASMFMDYQAVGQSRWMVERLSQRDAAWMAYWTTRERDPAARAAFLQSDAYENWKKAFLQAVADAGVFDAQMRKSALYDYIANHWRQVLARPVAGPEERLAMSLDSVLPLTFLGLYAAIAMAILVVTLNQAGLGATLGGAAINIGVALFTLTVSSLIIEALRVNYGWLLFSSLILACTAILAPLAVTALTLLRGIRGRWTALYGAVAIWAAAIWLPFTLSVIDAPSVTTYPPNGTGVSQIVNFVVVTLLVVGFAQLVHAMLARAAQFPSEL